MEDNSACQNTVKEELQCTCRMSANSFPLKIQSQTLFQSSNSRWWRRLLQTLPPVLPGAKVFPLLDKTFGKKQPLPALLLFLWRIPLTVPNCMIRICLADNGQFICISTFRPYTKQSQVWRLVPQSPVEGTTLTGSGNIPAGSPVCVLPASCPDFLLPYRQANGQTHRISPSSEPQPHWRRTGTGIKSNTFI